MEFNLLESPI